MNELKELRCDVHENSHFFKEKLKIWHDQHISSCIFYPSSKCFCMIHDFIYFQKICIQDGPPFIVKTLYPYSAIDIEDPKNGYLFKVYGLKHYLELSERMKESPNLVDPPIFP